MTPSTVLAAPPIRTGFAEGTKARRTQCSQSNHRLKACRCCRPPGVAARSTAQSKMIAAANAVDAAAQQLAEPTPATGPLKRRRGERARSLAAEPNSNWASQDLAGLEQ